jgi:DNA helicase HerA-like ATPase
VDKNVISQCNTQIILRVTNPNDIRALSQGLEFMSSEMEEEIKRIPQGVALLSSTSIEMPILVDIRVRRSEHGGRGAVMETTVKKKAPKYEVQDVIKEKEGKKGMLARLLGE